jgi:hypothetical protein
MLTAAREPELASPCSGFIYYYGKKNSRSVADKIVSDQQERCANAKKNRAIPQHLK